MAEHDISSFGKIITRLIRRENLSREEACTAFSKVLKNQTTEIQQGAFLAALGAKGETAEEIAGCHKAIYEIDTVKVYPHVNSPIIENCGTGMDSFKTFNISTAAAIIAACDGLHIARHGARAITSACGTVDMAECLGVDVECDASVVCSSLEKCGLALFNGMSSKIHPASLGRILSQIAFGTTLNIAASLANPVKVDIGVRGVYSKEMILPVISAMKEIGFKKALVFCGEIDSTSLVMDEASVCGQTSCAELQNDGTIVNYSFRPESVGLTTHKPDLLAPCSDRVKECRDFIALLKNRSSKVRTDAALLNAGMIFYAARKAATIYDGVVKAAEILDSGKAINKLAEWVLSQNDVPEKGMMKLELLMGY